MGGAVLTAASLRRPTAPNHIIFELKPKQSPVQFELVDRPVEQHGGWVEVRDTPGIGVGWTRPRCNGTLMSNEGGMERC